MVYQPLTKEQFQKATQSGFTPEQIIEMEKKRKTESEGAAQSSQQTPAQVPPSNVQNISKVGGRGSGFGQRALATAADITGQKNLGQIIGGALAKPFVRNQLAQADNTNEQLRIKAHSEYEKAKREGNTERMQQAQKAFDLASDTKSSLPTADQLIPKKTALQVAGSIGESAMGLATLGGTAAARGGLKLASKGVPLVSKLKTGAKVIGQGAATGGTSAAAEGTDIGRGILTGSAISAGLPVVGKVAKLAGKVTGRIGKGVGSALSGASQSQMNAVLDSPQAAQKAKKLIDNLGADNVLEDKVKKIVGGVSKIRQDARSSFGNALESLSKEDITPKVFRQNIQPTLDKYGSEIVDGERFLRNVEFDEPKNIKKASELIDKVQNAKTDGVSLRKLADDIENARYKTATGDERLSFNAFAKELSDSVKNAINKSTDKLENANANFSSEMQLAEATEKILGKVNYKNKSELNTVARKLEGLFNKEGLDPKTVDDFLTRIGLDPVEFRAGEAVRQMSGITQGANTPGLNPVEMIRGLTTAIITPKDVTNVLIKAGYANEQAKKLGPILSRLTPAIRMELIRMIQPSGE